MKNKTLSCLLIICLLLCGCYEQSTSPVGIALEGTHSLKSLYGHTSTQGKLDGCFLSVQGYINEVTKIRFCWLNNKNEYIISELPFTKVRFLIDDTHQPMIKFRWKAGYQDAISYGKMMESEVVYAVIICPEKDIPELK